MIGRISIYLVVTQVLFWQVQAQVWNGIRPCISERSETEKILGRDQKPGLIGIYSIPKFRVHIRYKLNSKSRDDDLVVNFTVYPTKIPTLKRFTETLKLFPQAFRKTSVEDKISHIHGLAFYRNHTEGYEIVVQKTHADVEIVTAITYFNPSDACSVPGEQR